ncbi:MAG TPA: choice-of-anchor Q domain-containing protein [Pyrinomonadaceae bacterium]|nr:choice-of-anchor Q domain-containing protein [Pyrinomonadaceae bacterium]
MIRFAVNLCFASVGLLAVFSVDAAVYTVTKTADTNDGICNSDCSLREAIAAANGTVDNDEIVFALPLFGTTQTITLASGELTVANNGSVSIDGPGANLLTVSGNNASRILVSGANVMVSIEGIRFTAGNGVGAVNSGRGGAIYNVGGTMLLANSILTGNSAANGGALNNAAAASPSVPANLTIDNCVISNNNSTSSGAAMQNFSTSTLHIRNSTINNNTTSGTGIAGAFQANGTVTITNTTFSGNSAPAGTGGGLYFNGTSLIMTNSTLANNTCATGGGGLHRTGTNPTANVRNTIIALNTGPAATLDVSGAITSQGNNIVGTVGTSTGWIATDLINTNPMLGTLADNGGFGMTLLPLTGSPAINAGHNCVVDLSCSASNPPQAVTTDQRGITRPQGPTVDIGAVEVAAVQANATVSGRVVTSFGQGVFRAYVTISGPGGVIRTAVTNNFGNFTFKLIPTGQTYTIDVSSKQGGFSPQQVIVNGDVTDITIMPSDPSLWRKR